MANVETLNAHIELLIGIEDNAYKCFIFIANNAIYMTSFGTHFDTHNSQGTKLFNLMT